MRISPAAACLAALALVAVPLCAQSPTSTSTQPYFEFQVEKPVKQLQGSVEYPPLLRSAGVEGQVLAQFIVDDSAHFVPGSFKVLKSSHELFTQAVRNALPTMKFSAAEIHGHAVAQVVMQPFTFSLTPGAGVPAPKVPNTTSPPAPRPDTFRPDVVQFGASLANLQRNLQNVCVWMKTRRIDPPFKVLTDIRDRQYQVDCEGFWFAGKQRHAEFVVADDALEMVWIMTDRVDASTIQGMMSRNYGESDAGNDRFYAFTRGHAALRVDVPEVLFYSDRLATRVQEWFGPHSTF